MNWLRAKQTKFLAYALVYSLIVLLVLGLTNFLANRYNKAFDFTANKRYSLADQTLKIVRNLKTNVTIRYFDQQPRFRNAKDLIDRYVNLSTRLTAKYSDPDQNPQEARQVGITEIPTVLIEANGRRERAKAVTEQEITGALIRVLKEGERRVCGIAGGGEASFQDGGRLGYSSFGEVLTSNNYKVDTARVLESPAIPPNCTIVLVGGPKLDYEPEAINALKTYVEGGGRLMVLLDPPLRAGTAQVADNQPLLDLLAGWGITANKDLIFEGGSRRPAVPVVQQYDNHEIVREMRNLPSAFSLSRSLDFAAKDKVRGTKLFSSSTRSFATTNMVSPEPEFDATKDKKGPLTLAVAATRETGEGKQAARIVVVGSSEWVDNEWLRTLANQDLAMNMINWLSSDEDLISIRPREQDNRPLALNESSVNALALTSLILIPALILVAGIAVWWKRR